VIEENQEAPETESVRFQRLVNGTIGTSLSNCMTAVLNEDEILSEDDKGHYSFLQKSMLAGSVLIALYIFSKSLLGQDLLNRMRFILYMNGF